MKMRPGVTVQAMTAEEKKAATPSPADKKSADTAQAK
jgi:hypothetical protein